MYLRQEAMVYLVVHQPPTRERVRELAAKLGITISADRYAMLPETAAESGGYRATVGEMTPTSLGDLDVNLSDDGNYMLWVRSEQPDDDSPDAPANDRAKAIAEAF